MKHKHLVRFLLSVIFVMIGLQSMPVSTKAKTTEETKPDGDLQPMEAYEISDDDIQQTEYIVYSGSESETVQSAVYRSDWSKYGDDYCYNNLNTLQKKLYDEMYAKCESYINTCENAIPLTVGGKSVYGMGTFSYEGLTTEEMQELTYVFIFQNPQFYFITSSVYYNDAKSYYYIRVFDIFADGEERSAVSKQMYDKIDAWVVQINQKSSQYAKETAAHDIVCNQTVYQSNDYDQSAYSTVMLGQTVCAGYAKLYSILTNAAGLETVSVTSATHGWNKTKLGDKWYNVDTTWDDGTTILYKYFNKSDTTMKSYDSSSSESHTQHAYYDLLAPACPDDYGKDSVDADSVVVSPAALVFDMEKTTQANLSVSFEPAEPTNTEVVYTSMDPSVVQVDLDGTVTAVAPGKTSVVVRKPTNNLKAYCEIEVYGRYETPDAPEVTFVSTTGVSMAKLSGCVYSMDGVNWQSTPVFSDLNSNTEYIFYVKKLANGYYRESKVSAGTKVRTLSEEEENPVTPDNPEVSNIPTVSVGYRTHIQTYGWEDDWRRDGFVSGTSGLAKRLEGIKIIVAGNSKLGIRYTTHCQGYGWLPWSANGDMSGTEGEAKRLEAIKICLTGEDKDAYDVYYRVHAQSFGWLGWAKNGAPAGTAGLSKRLEAIQILVVKRGQDIDSQKGNITSNYLTPYFYAPGMSVVVNAQPTSNQNPQISGEQTPNVTYRTHVQTYGWQGYKYNGAISGTTGVAKRLEGIQIKLTNAPYSGDIRYTTHVQTYGWQGDIKNPNTWSANGAMSGTSGQAKRLEAIRISLTGEMAEHYDVYYRVHAQSFGWLGWAKNGAPAGTSGYAKRLEGIRIVLVPKGGNAPGSTDKAYLEK